MNEKFKVLDLFSGIGGFSLGLERTGGFETVAFVEADPFCQRVLIKNWPLVEVWNDVRSLTGEQLERTDIDVICGGFPCQPFSHASAGKRAGKNDDRYLWPHMLRLVSEIRPRWVIGENVVGIEGVALEQVVSDLEGEGYEVAPPLEIPACAVGHDHWRPRFWFVAHANGDCQSSGTFHAKASRLPKCNRYASRVGTADGVPGGLDRHRLRALGNAVVPQIPEIIGRAILEAEGKIDMSD
jgi:DNA (cytosine-5)-methyltransferase 1